MGEGSGIDNAGPTCIALVRESSALVLSQARDIVNRRLPAQNIVLDARLCGLLHVITTASPWTDSQERFKNENKFKPAPSAHPRKYPQIDSVILGLVIPLISMLIEVPLSLDNISPSFVL